LPTLQPIARGSSDGTRLNLNEKQAGPYTILFFNAAGTSIAESEATVTYLTIGHCP
jgi:hypothetical protein